MKMSNDEDLARYRSRSPLARYYSTRWGRFWEIKSAFTFGLFFLSFFCPIFVQTMLLRSWQAPRRNFQFGFESGFRIWQTLLLLPCGVVENWPGSFTNLAFKRRREGLSLMHSKQPAATEHQRFRVLKPTWGFQDRSKTKFHSCSELQDSVPIHSFVFLSFSFQL
jgi:hypothetical protein